MKATLLVCAKPDSEHGGELFLFAHPKASSCLFSFNLARDSLLSFAKQYPMLHRQAEFDWAVEKLLLRCFLFLWETKPSGVLPAELVISGANVAVEWLSFPALSRLLTEGTEKNFLQLAVQYLAEGGVQGNLAASLLSDLPKQVLG